MTYNLLKRFYASKYVYLTCKKLEGNRKSTRNKLLALRGSDWDKIKATDNAYDALAIH